MPYRARLFFAFFLSAGILVSPSFAQQEGAGDPPKPQLSPKQQRRRSSQALKELNEQYKHWLNEDVIYIISPEERTAFLQLSTNEEREQFMEQFWLRRNPNPDEQANEFKEEHYRRIAYANEHFASGIPGWKTDRGKVYIIWGPPNQISSHPTGGLYDRPYEEGGGQTVTLPWETWTYGHMEGIGENVTLEFVDTTQSDEYRLTMDPGEKDALQKIPNAGLSNLEQMGLANKEDRLTQNDGTTLPTGPYSRNDSSQDEFWRFGMYSKVFSPPEVKFKDLEALVTSRIVREQVHFTYRTDFLKVTSDTVLVPVTVLIPNSEISFKNRDEVYSGSLNVFGRVSTMTGRVVQTFEEVITRDFPASLFQQSQQGYSIYQKAVPLRPGLYRLDLVLKDVQSENVGVENARLAVPRFEEDKIQASSLILADQIVAVPDKEIASGQFVLGASKVRPRMNLEFTTREKLGIYLQIYNLKLDEHSHKTNAVVEFVVKKGGDSIFDFRETSTDLKQMGEQLTIERLLPLATLAPGKYSIEVKTTDQIANQTISRSSEFTVKNAPEIKVAVSSTSGR